VTAGPGRLGFPEGFVWGAATASYQIEGGVDEDGRGPSIWDTFSHTPGKVANGDTGDVACDHYHRWEEDLDLVADLGLSSYRFSVAWPRVVPTADGPVNEAGLDFYDRLVDGLLARGIDPLITLYHWDLPQWLEDDGGWLARDTSWRFAEYAGVVAARLGDRVRRFSTHNEPYCSSLLGYGAGVHAPGIRGIETALRAAHHLNLAHGLGTVALRAHAARELEVSVVLNVAQVYAASDDPADAVAARHVDDLSNKIFLEPMLRGRYPQTLLEDMAAHTDWGFVHDGDLALIQQPIDLLGVNYYTPSRICGPRPGLTDQAASTATGRWVDDPAGTATPVPVPWPATDRAWSVPQPGPYTDMGWRIEPEAFTDLLTRLSADYPEIPMMVTENGCAYADGPGADGAVHDERRIDYLRSHLAAVHAAIEKGADIRGYYLWSLLDNFEWALGYAKRFGLVHVDYDTLARTPKDSAYWYRDVVKANAVS
jgi:beta-glucosidase